MRVPRGLVVALVIGCKGPAADTDTETPVLDTEDTDVVDTDTDTDGPQPTTLDDVLILPFDGVVRAGTTVQMRARSVMSDGTLLSATSGLVWSAVGAPIGSDGLLTAVTAGGGTTVAVSVGDLRTFTRVEVARADATIDAIRIVPGNPTLRPGADFVLAAYTEFNDGSRGDLGASCTWSSVDPSVATVGAAGVVSAAAPGETTIEAACEDWVLSTNILVDPVESVPDLVVEELRTVDLGDGDVLYQAHVANNGATSQAFALDVYPLADAPGPDRGDPAIVIPGLGNGQSRWVTLVAPYPGDRPATLKTWAAVDTEQHVAEAREDNNAIGPIALELSADPAADVQVDFAYAIVFGPYESGIEIEVTNAGPTDLTDLVLAFERDRPGVASLADLDALDAEATEVLPSLPAGESYTWVFTYDDAPFGAAWSSCAFVEARGFDDPNLDDNYDCIEFAE